MLMGIKNIVSNKTKIKVDNLERELEKLKNSYNFSSTCLAAAEKNIDEFKKVIEDLKQEIDDLETKNANLVYLNQKMTDDKKILLEDNIFLKRKLAYISVVIGKDAMNLFDFAARKDLEKSNEE